MHDHLNSGYYGKIIVVAPSAMMDESMSLATNNNVSSIEKDLNATDVSTIGSETNDIDAALQP